jgi:hypothetical protein
MPSIKRLIEVCKSLNFDLRHEYDGETWNVWFGRDDCPDYQHISSERLVEVLKTKIEQKANELRLTKKSIEHQLKLIGDLFEE